MQPHQPKLSGLDSTSSPVNSDFPFSLFEWDLWFEILFINSVFCVGLMHLRSCHLCLT